MKVTVKYFAAMREEAGKNEEIVETVARTPAELFRELKGRYRIGFEESNLKVALNEEYSDFSTPLKESDVVAFIPPVAGG